MEINQYNEQFEKHMEELGFQVSTSHVSDSKEYALSYYYRNHGVGLKGLNVLIKISAIIVEDSLVIQVPSVYKRSDSVVPVLGIYGYFTSLAQLLAIPKVQLSEDIVSDYAHKEYQELLMFSVQIGFKRNQYQEFIFDCTSQIYIYPILSDIIMAIDKLKKVEPTFTTKISFEHKNNFGKLLEIKYEWEGTEGKITVTSKSESIYLIHQETEILLNGSNAFSVLMEILREVSETQKLKNLIDPPVTHLFKAVSRILDKERRPLSIYETLAKEIMSEFIESGYDYKSVESEAVVVNKPLYPYRKKIRLIEDCHVVQFLDKHLVFIKVSAAYKWKLCNSYNEAIDFILEEVKGYLIGLK